MADFCDNLRAAREMRGLSQQELAHESGLHATAVSHFERGDRGPSLGNLMKLAGALEVSIDDLAYGMGCSTIAGELFEDIYTLSADHRAILEGFVEVLVSQQRRSQ